MACHCSALLPAQALALVRSPASLIVFLLVQLGQQTIQKPICSNCRPKTSVIHFHRPLCLYSSWDSLNLRWTYKLDVSATRYSWELKLRANWAGDSWWISATCNKIQRAVRKCMKPHRSATTSQIQYSQLKVRNFMNEPFRIPMRGAFLKNFFEDVVWYVDSIFYILHCRT